eukprot:12967817-Ditylum_brightwellii.AAC.1
MANAIIDEETGRSLEYRELITKPQYKKQWTHSLANELGRLAQGLKRGIKGTDTIIFTPFEELPHERRKDITYGRIVCDYRLQKNEPNCTCLTVGGDRINYPNDISTPTADTTMAKLLINSTISDAGARYMCAD